MPFWKRKEKKEPETFDYDGHTFVKETPSTVVGLLEILAIWFSAKARNGDPEARALFRLLGLKMDDKNGECFMAGSWVVDPNENE
jgi:hypothetical protein